MSPKDFIGVIRTRRWIVIVCVVVITSIAAVGTFNKAPTFSGVAQVLLTQQTTGTTFLGTPEAQLSIQPQRDVDTQVRVMQSRALVEQAIKLAGLKTTSDQLLKQVTVSADGQTDIVTIEVLDTSADRAAKTANALAQAYVAWSADLQRANIKAAADNIEAQLILTKKQIDDAEASLRSGRGLSATQQENLRAARNLYSQLADKLNQLRANQELVTGSGRILTNAVVNPERVSPNRPLEIGLGFVISLVFGLGLAFLTEKLDTRIMSAEEAERVFDAPVLGSIPLEEYKDDEASRLTLVQHPGGPAAEAYRMLRANLDFINFEHDIRTVLVTSATPGEGKSTVAANLATCLSQAGKRVALVICDFHRPASEAFFGVNDTIGLSDVLLGLVGEVPLQQPTGLDNLWILAPGKLPPNTSELLSSRRMSKLVEELRSETDWVILDSPPLLALADAKVIARLVDGVLMVVRIGASRSDSAREGREQLDNVGARILGVATWGIRRSPTADSYSGYSRYRRQEPE